MFGDNVITLKSVYKWYEGLKSGNKRIEFEQWSGRPLIKNMEK